jgi:hypothetical protein
MSIFQNYTKNLEKILVYFVKKKFVYITIAYPKHSITAACIIITLIHTYNLRVKQEDSTSGNSTHIVVFHFVSHSFQMELLHEDPEGQA